MNVNKSISELSVDDGVSRGHRRKLPSSSTRWRIMEQLADCRSLYCWARHLSQQPRHSVGRAVEETSASDKVSMSLCSDVYLTFHVPLLFFPPPPSYV